MNTPAHIVVNAIVLRTFCNSGGHSDSGSESRRSLDGPIMLGAVLPDLPMFVFYGIQKYLGTPEHEIWSSRYFAPTWQAFFDVFNSVFVVGLLLAIGWRNRFLRLMALSMMLHAAADFPLHHDDGHRHFWPLEFRFESPVSYWDFDHFGWFVLPLEVTCTVIGAVWLAFRSTKVWRWVYLVVGPGLVLLLATLATIAYATRPA